MRYLLFLLLATPVIAHDVNYPRFSGDIHFTRPNDQQFINFLDQNTDKVVYLDLLFTAEFGGIIGEEMQQACNSHFNFWDEGMGGHNIFLPIYNPDPDNPPEDFDMADIECEILPIRFVDTELLLSSAGPGAHWFDIEGFFLIRNRSDRWPFIEIKELEAHAETWAQILNK